MHFVSELKPFVTSWSGETLANARRVDHFSSDQITGDEWLEVG
jgi:hypothetical protein